MSLSSINCARTDLILTSSSLKTCILSIVIYTLVLLSTSGIGKSRSSCVKLADPGSPLAPWTSQVFVVNIGSFSVSILLQISQMVFFHADCDDYISPFTLNVTINLIALFTSVFDLASDQCYVCRDIFG